MLDGILLTPHLPLLLRPGTHWPSVSITAWPCSHYLIVFVVVVYLFGAKEENEKVVVAVKKTTLEYVS